jgi:hypothetical protein
MVVGETLHEYLGLGAGGQANKSQVLGNLRFQTGQLVQEH